MLNGEKFKKCYNDLIKVKSKKTAMLPRQLCIRCCRWLVNRSLLQENYADFYFFDKEVADEYDNKIAELERNRKKIFTTEDIKKFYYSYRNNMGQYPSCSFVFIRNRNASE